ncbi:SRPBCC family protein [Fulvivirgaceae bacterium BMA10]|uniref:SRPBCC family protein n=1 Tax=Splendidivirga corallicola TaxID=3051826 RepID=A0ABT8KQN9_9BACT|nr:SRPBCC family protein [Fulvivirgaceae bacterium BMA10]
MKPKTTINVNKGTVEIRSEVIIESSQEEVWNAISIPGEIEKFHPLIKKSKTESTLFSGNGSRRLCELLPMGKMIETVTDWKNGSGYTSLVIGGAMLPPYEFMSGTIALHEFNEKTVANFSFSYKLKYGVIGRFLDKTMIRPQFKKAPPKYVLGLKYYVENGRKISSEELKRY